MSVVTLHFHLVDEPMPEDLAKRVAGRCAGTELRAGESISVEGDDGQTHTYTATVRSIEQPVFGVRLERR